ncbi:hypothetical protein RchiOBHm_Chr5g0011501 [Rosa chinensis]|uniref:Uncharacterized protein n=1 Tax=Rosa chinensis TaxID=74649 RepID=A0A2P6Q4Y4_ROSCH|nr:hypothetical protein RchiOBHm_Chr5g0011501 [Rosa chinensis]
MERVIMESLDSLWFYSNVFCPRTPVWESGAASLTKRVQEEHVIEEVLKPALPIVEDHKNESESEAGSLVPVTPRCAEVGITHVDDVAEVVEYYCPSPREKEQRRKRSRSKRGLQRNRRRILGEIDLGFHVKAEVSGCDWIFLEENFGYKNQFNLNDNMAMKEHLRTWAYAVACTVR